MSDPVDGLPRDRWEQDILPQGGYIGGDLARRPCLKYLGQSIVNLDKPVYFLAVRFTHWDRYPEIYKTAPDDMSMAMWRTEATRNEYAKEWIKAGHKVIVGTLTPRRLIEVLGAPLEDSEMKELQG